MKLTKKVKDRIHREVAEASGGAPRGATWNGFRPTVFNDKRPKVNKKARRAESKRLCSAW